MLLKIGDYQDKTKYFQTYTDLYKEIGPLSNISHLDLKIFVVHIKFD